MRKKNTSGTGNKNKQQKILAKKLDHICVFLCVLITLATAILEYRDRKASGQQESLHGGRTVI